MKETLYVIFGYEGILGRAFFQRLHETISDHRLFFFAHGHVDVTNQGQVREVLGYVGPSVVINCAGISELELCERAKAGAMTVNGIGAKTVAEECHRIGAKVVWFSSPHVFGGKRRKPYTERCAPAPVNALGLSKLEGEKCIRQSGAEHIIIRPGWLFDPVEGMPSIWLGQLDRGMAVGVRPDCYGSAVFSYDLVDATIELMLQNASGTFHVANSDATSLEAMARQVCDLVHANKKIVQLSPRRSSFLAPFPEYSVLSCKKYEDLAGYSMRTWSAGIKQCLFQMGRYKP